MSTMTAEPRTVGELRQAARAIAAAVLDEHWDEGTLPIDPVVVSRRLGLEMFTAQLGNDVSGMLVGDASGARAYLDVDQPPTRARFTAAHELGHYVDRSSRLDGDIAYVDRRSDEGRGTRDEIWANEFAGNLLMPERQVRRFVELGKTDVQMAQEFGVSLSALSYRLQVLGL